MVLGTEEAIFLKRKVIIRRVNSNWVVTIPISMKIMDRPTLKGYRSSVSPLKLDNLSSK